MKTRTQPTSAFTPVASGSWTALLAAATLGVDAADPVHAEVRSDAAFPGADYRLVVQSYDRSSSGVVPGTAARPVASMQRAVTAAELRRGVRVDLLELRQPVPVQDGARPVVLAWVEEGKPDLEFDGRMARPRPGSVYGLAKRDAALGSVRISMRQRLAA